MSYDGSMASLLTVLLLPGLALAPMSAAPAPSANLSRTALTAPLSVGTPPPFDSVAPALRALARSDAAPGEERGKEPDLPKGPPIGKVKECCGYPLAASRGFRLSFYWLAWEAEYANEPYDTGIYTRDGFYLGRFPRAFVFELKLEGSGILRDGRIINYDGDCAYGVGTCFRAVDPKEHPVGVGGQGRPLEPYRSVAIDPRLVPIGTPLYIPELRGLRLASGGLHDGCVRADDTGGGIKHRKVDFFVESYAHYKQLADRLWWDMGITPLVEEPRCEYLRRGDPSRERTNEHSDWVALHQPRARPLARAPLKKGRPQKVAGAAAGSRLSVAFVHSAGKKGAAIKKGGAKRRAG